MDSQPLITIMIVHSDEPTHLAEAVESVVAQTYSNWKLLLLENGAGGASREVSSHYASQYPDKVRCLKRPDYGNVEPHLSYLSLAREAEGVYVAFLEATDVWLPRKLEEQVSILETHPEAVMVYGRPLIWHSWTGGAKGMDYTCEAGVEPNTLVNPPDLVPLVLNNQYETATLSDTMLRRQALYQMSELPTDTSSLAGASALFVALMLSSPVFVSGTCWTKRRRTTNPSRSSTENTERADERLAFLTCLRELFVGRQVKDPAIWHALENQFINYSYDEVRRTITANFPALHVERIAFLGEGLGSRTYRINGEYIFRFPKHSAARRALAVEIRLLEQLQDRVSLPIPRFEFVKQGDITGLAEAGRAWRIVARLTKPLRRMIHRGAADEKARSALGQRLDTFVGYKEIKGSLLYPEFLLGLSDESRRNLATDVGRFMNSLHSFPVDAARSLGAKERCFGSKYYEAAFEAVRKHVLPGMPGEQRRNVVALFEEQREDPDGTRYHPALLHGDLNWSHLIFDETNVRIAGIIDFGGTFIGDPAYDFIEMLHKYDVGFLRLVIERYGVSDPARFFNRVVLLGCCETAISKGSAMIYDL